MSVLGLEHVNIRTPDPAATIAFFRDVLGMQVGHSPRSTSTEDGAWILDANGVAVVHIARASLAYPSDEKLPFTPRPGSGTLHHVALKCSDFEATRARIQARNLPFYENHMAQYQLRQIFVSDPNGILFELNFSAETH